MATRLSTHLVDQLDRLYAYRNQVMAFLEQHPFLVPSLVEAHTAIQRFFPEAPCFLEIFSDPDSAGHQEIFLGIGVTSQDAKAVFTAMQAFDREWLLPNGQRSEGLLTIDVEFV